VKDSRARGSRFLQFEVVRGDSGYVEVGHQVAETGEGVLGEDLELGVVLG